MHRSDFCATFPALLASMSLVSCGPSSTPSPLPVQPSAPASQASASPVATIQSIIAQQLRIPADRIKPEATLGSLGADDLDVVEIVMATEEALDITLSDEALGPIDPPPGSPTLAARLTVGAFTTAASHAPKAKFPSPKLEEPQDGSLRMAQVGRYSDLRQLPNPRGYELIFVPELAAMELAAERKLGQKLTDPERAAIKEKATVMALPPDEALQFLDQRRRARQAKAAAPDGSAAPAPSD